MVQVSMTNKSPMAENLKHWWFTMQLQLTHVARTMAKTLVTYFVYGI